MEKNKEKKAGFLDDIQGELFASTIESLLPKIKPFIAPAVEKFKEFLGDNEKTIVIRRNKGGSPTVIVFDNSAFDEEGTGYSILNSKTEKHFKSNPDAVKDVYNVDDFINKLLTGDLMKEMGK